VVALPTQVQGEKVEAAFQDGILTIKLAKPEEIKPLKIEVKVV
jgi:HSP20 family molecular chaperone IbpA